MFRLGLGYGVGSSPFLPLFHLINFSSHDDHISKKKWACKVSSWALFFFKFIQIPTPWKGRQTATHGESFFHLKFKRWNVPCPSFHIQYSWDKKDTNSSPRCGCITGKILFSDFDLSRWKDRVTTQHFQDISGLQQSHQLRNQLPTLKLIRRRRQLGNYASLITLLIPSLFRNFLQSFRSFFSFYEVSDKSSKLWESCINK